MIAPCGMNCMLCSGYQRDKNKCLGCNGSDDEKPRYCVTCSLKVCNEASKTDPSLCSCDKLPCKRLRQLDKRYTSRYGMSMLENLKMIKEQGMKKFLESQRKKWTCKKCGESLSVHKDKCLNCGSKNKFYCSRVNTPLLASVCERQN